MKIANKYRSWGLLLLAFIAMMAYYFNISSTNYYKDLKKISAAFSKYEKDAENIIQKLAKQIEQHESFSIGETNTAFNVHIYKNDSLFQWNTNKVPISKYADIQFPTNGLFKGQNAWYYVKTKVVKAYTIAVSFKIKNEYSYQNDYLKNDFTPPFKGPFASHISLDEASGYPIYSNKKQYLFSIVVNDYQALSKNESLILATLILLVTFLLLWNIQQELIKIRSNWVWLSLPIILVLRWFSLKYNWFGILNDTEIYRASLYGTSSIFPNLFEFSLNILLLINIVYFVYLRSKISKPITYKWFLIATITIPYFAWNGATYLFKGLIENSSIPMHIEEIFKLNTYSLIAILSMALLGFSMFIIGKTIVTLMLKNNINIRQLLSYNIICGIIYFSLDHYFVNQIPLAAIFPLIFTTLIYLLEYIDFKQKHLLIGMLLLAVYSLTCAFTISAFNTRKDKSERELYANQLMIERDVITEVEYNKLETELTNDKLIQKLISSGQKISLREFEAAIDRRHFKEFWERYECAYNLFTPQQESILLIQGNSQEIFNNLEDLINNHGQPSEINQSIYFINDYTGQYSYIIRQPLKGKNDEDAILYVTLKSKKIPEEIGFPRLLLSNKSTSLKHLENYSVAKYHKGRLVSKYGQFNYPNTISTLNKANAENKANFDFKGYNHFIHYKSKQDVAVLSGTNITWIDNATSFSYLFSIFGILLLPYYIRNYTRAFSNKSITLSTKIQLTLIATVLFSLVITGISSGIFVKDQYSEYSNLAYKQKTQSIEMELKPLINKFTQLSIQENGAFLNYQLQNLSKIFFTDINIYDKDGFIVSTSRQNIFNQGLLSEQINADAQREMAELNQSEFIHLENIGTLSYFSSYAPLYNKNGIKLGYVNLQHFGQQEEAENQLHQFIVSIINIFVFLLVISTVMAIFTANWITNPLQMLQELFSNIHLGKSNQRIQYNKNDEIGSLVKSYNEKIEELEIAAQQIAQSERESAWRDMAKQVAHEIKNPLTPMKLSVQHLMRSFDPSAPNATERINQVSQSLIEQIEALTKIANEFSNFAKMPKPEFETINISTIIKNSIEIFQLGNKIVFNYSIPENLPINGDKEQILRVFNNIIKNAIQAITDKENGEIIILAQQLNKQLIITVQDNGIGMSEEQKQKIFTPYFTTKTTGSGIGLAMVKQIIENHEGKISFESTEGVGTTFTIEFPLIQD